MRPAAGLTLLLLALSGRPAVPAAAQTAPRGQAAQISRIERGLLPPIVIRGRPLPLPSHTALIRGGHRLAAHAHGRSWDRAEPLARPTRTVRCEEGFTVAEFGLFIGWGSSRVGREAAAGRLFEEAVVYWNGLQAAGGIESVDLVLLGAHGGDLGGFALLRGDPEKLGRLSMAPEFERLTMRAGACLDGVGVVSAVVDAGVMRSMGEWKEAIADLL